MIIETNVPMPKANGKGRPAKYPFGEMDIGDSVFIEGQAVGGSAYLSAMQHARLHSKKFTGRTVEGGLRIWRVA